jgi:hypothetical protein
MAYNARVFRILIASPSDVQQEREAAVRVIQRWNDLYSNTRGVVILPVRWETHTAPEFNVRPQEAINLQIVDDADLVVGIFWTRIGTPTGEAASGTVEEIERVAQAGKQVMLYFSQAPMNPYEVESRQMAKVKSFRENVQTNARIETFTSLLDFQDKFADHLEMRIRKLLEADAGGQPQPLDLQFVSLDDGQLVGQSLSTQIGLLELSEPPLRLDPELKEVFDLVFHNARSEAASVPVVLAITNIGSSGIRNLHVKVAITATDGSFKVSNTTPWQSMRLVGQGNVLWTNFLTQDSEPSEVERKLEKLTVEGLTKEGNEWRFDFDWDAIQPQRRRYIQPYIFLEVLTPCKANVRAMVYADNFSNPIVLEAQVTVAVQPRVVQTDVIIETAKKLSEKASRSVTSVGGWNRTGPVFTATIKNEEPGKRELRP